MRNPPQLHALRGISLVGDEKRRLDERWRDRPRIRQPDPGCMLPPSAAAAFAGICCRCWAKGPRVWTRCRRPSKPRVMPGKRTAPVQFLPRSTLTQCDIRRKTHCRSAFFGRARIPCAAVGISIPQGRRRLRACSLPPLVELGARRNLSRPSVGRSGCRGAGWAATALCHPVMRRAATRVAAADLRSSAWRTRQDTRR